MGTRSQVGAATMNSLLLCETDMCAWPTRRMTLFLFVQLLSRVQELAGKTASGSPV